jgi:hypothetical protein
VLERAHAAAARLRAGCPAGGPDPVFLLLPEYTYSRGSELARSEIYAVLQKLGVRIGGGDIEQACYYFDRRGLLLTREALYAALGGGAAGGKPAGGAPEKWARRGSTVGFAPGVEEAHPEFHDKDGEFQLPTKAHFNRTASTESAELYGKKADKSIDTVVHRRSQHGRTASTTSFELYGDAADGSVAPGSRRKSMDSGRTVFSESKDLGWDEEKEAPHKAFSKSGRLVSSESKDLGWDEEKPRGRNHTERTASTETSPQKQGVHQYYETQGLPIDQLRTMNTIKRYVPHEF